MRIAADVARRGRRLPRHARHDRRPAARRMAAHGRAAARRQDLPEADVSRRRWSPVRRGTFSSTAIYDVLLDYNCAHAYAFSVGLLSDRVANRSVGRAHTRRSGHRGELRLMRPEEPPALRAAGRAVRCGQCKTDSVRPAAARIALSEDFDRLVASLDSDRRGLLGALVRTVPHGRARAGKVAARRHGRFWSSR